MESERGLWNMLHRGLKGRWHVTRHEDALTAGIPDVSYGMNGCNGWIELKEPEGWWPKRGGVLPSPFRTAQVRWMLQRSRRARLVFALCLVNGELVLMSPLMVLAIHEPTPETRITERHLRESKEAVITRNVNDLEAFLSGEVLLRDPD